MSTYKKGPTQGRPFPFSVGAAKRSGKGLQQAITALDAKTI